MELRVQVYSCLRLEVWPAPGRSSKELWRPMRQASPVVAKNQAFWPLPLGPLRKAAEWESRPESFSLRAKA